MVGYCKVECFNRCVRQLFKEHSSQPGRLTASGISGFLLGKIKNKFPNKRRHGNRTTCFGHDGRPGFYKQKTGSGIICYTAPVRRISGYPDGMSGRDKPQSILNFTTHCTMQGQDKLTLPVRMRHYAGILLRRCSVKGNRWLQKDVSVKFIGRRNYFFMFWHILEICCLIIYIL
jgi:hypothetical protein